MVRNYSGSDVPVIIFLDLLRTLARVGWFSLAPNKVTDLEIDPRISFHLHPEDAGRVYDLLVRGMREYSGETEWHLSLSDSNRFVLRPENFHDGSSGFYKPEARTAEGYMANLDLILLSDYIYSIRDSD